MITQIEYERLQQEIDDLKWKLVSYEQIDKGQRRKIDQLTLECDKFEFKFAECEQKLRDARAKERERCSELCASIYTEGAWGDVCAESIRELGDEE